VATFLFAYATVARGLVPCIGALIEQRVFLRP
jgi:hypothetical protein